MNELSLLGIQASATYEQARESFKTKLSEVLGRDNASAAGLCSAWESVKREHFRINDNARGYVSDDKLKISLPVYILTRGHYLRLQREFESIGDRRGTFDTYLTANLNEAARTGFPPLIAPSEIQSPEFFNILAQRTNLYLNYCASIARGSLFQIGLDRNEAFAIVNQHSWYKRFAGYGAITVPVLSADLDRKQSEQNYYGPGMLNAKSHPYLLLDPRCRIKPEEIIRWETGQYYPYENLNIPETLLNQPRAAVPVAAGAHQAPAQVAGLSQANPFANYFGLFLRALWQLEPENNAPQAAAAHAANVVNGEADDIILPGNAPAQAERKVFEGIIDPVTFDVIEKAVTTCSGWTYNETTILEILRTNPRNPAEPMSRASLLGAEAYRVNHTVTSLTRRGFDPTAQTRDVPQEFIDPLNQSLIRKPVLAEDGFCYDTDVLKSACEKPGNRGGMIISPRDGKTLIGKSLFVDRTIIALLDEFHAHRTDNIDGLLPCFPEQMTIAQLLDAISHYSEIIDVEAGRKIRNFYLADRLLRMLEIKADSVEEKMIIKLKRGNLDYQHALNSGASKKESAARALLCLSQALTELLLISNFSKSDQLISLLDGFCKAAKEWCTLLSNKKPASLEFVNLDLLQQNITRLSDIISEKEFNPRQKLYRMQEVLQQKTLVMFDYDGTLVTIGVPKRAITDKALLKQMLQSLVSNPNVTVAICSKQGQEKRTAKSVEPSMEEFLLKELELSVEDAAKIQLYGMDAYNTYMRGEAGKPADSIVPFKVAMANKIHREKAGITKFVYVNDSLYELEEMQKTYADVVAVPVLLNATTNRLINNDIFNGLIARENYKGPIDAAVVTTHVNLEEVWRAGYATEYAVSRDMRNKDERHMHCAAAGYFLVSIEVLRKFIDHESRARDKSSECIRLATKLIHELAQINPRELTPTAIQGYLNIQLSGLKRQANGHRLARWLIVVVDQIKSGFLAQREFIAHLEQQEASVRAESDRKMNALAQQRQQLAAELVSHLHQQFPGFACQFIALLDKYKNPNITNDNFRLKPENVFKDCTVSPACTLVRDAFIQAACDIRSKTQFNVAGAALPVNAQFDGKALTQTVLNKIFTVWEEKKKIFDELQSKASGVTSWFSTKLDNPLWTKPATQDSLLSWLQSITQYLKQCKNISKEHPAVNLMELCHEIFALPVTRLGHDKVNEFVAVLEKRISELEQAPVAHLK